MSMIKSRNQHCRDYSERKVLALLAREHGFESLGPTELGHRALISNHRFCAAKGEAKSLPGSS